MDNYRCAADLIRLHQPERPVLAFRLHAVERAARWFLQNFPGKCLYAIKANDAPHVLADGTPQLPKWIDANALVRPRRDAA